MKGETLCLVELFEHFLANSPVQSFCDLVHSSDCDCSSFTGVV